MNYKILLLGCTGEVGSRLSKLLLEKGHVVFGISGSRECKIAHPNHICVRINLLLINNLFSEISFKPDILIHTAWTTEYNTYKNSHQNFEWLNVSKKIISDFIEKGGKYLVVTSTCYEYSWSSEKALSENSKVVPITLYGQSKHQLLKWIQDNIKIPFLWTRTFFQFGLAEPPERLIPSLIDALHNNTHFLINSPSEIRDYVFIEDIVNILTLLIQNQKIGIYNIGTGTGVSSRQLANLIGQIFDKENLILYDESNHSKSKIISNPTKLMKSVKNFTWTSLESAIILTIKERINGDLKL
jgi:UDP-glucose 4-epimerase